MDTTKLIAEALYLAVDALEEKMELNDDYTEEDIEAITQKIYDLKIIESALNVEGAKAFVLSDDATAIVAAAVAPSIEEIFVGGIFSDAWPEVHENFPTDVFRDWAAAHPGYRISKDGGLIDPPNEHNYYDPDAGE